MIYILSGNAIELERVVREQRVRVERGLIKLTPLDTTLANLTNAVNDLADGARYPETDSKGTVPGDSKEVSITDTKDVTADDSKEVSAVDEKTTAKATAKESARTAKK